jgi:serine protease Do
MEDLRQGDLVLAIGNPMGLRNAVSLGVVSATAQALTATSPFGYIQTDASINPGNSGGALVDAEGRLVGINTFILSRSGGNEGLGFAIPADIVQDVVDQIRQKGHVDRGEIGVILQDISPPLSSALSLTRGRGVILADVEPEGPADRAGLRIGDLVLSVNGLRVESVSRFRSYAFSRRPEENVKVEFQRGTERLHAEIVMRSRHAAFDPVAALASPEKHLVARLGVLGIEIDHDIAHLVPQLRESSGVLVATRAAEGLVQWIDLQPGDVIHAINGEPVVTLDFLRQKVKDLAPGAAVALQVERDGRMQYVAFEIE